MNKNIIPNLNRACELLRLLAKNPDGLSATTIEEKIGLARTTAFRILSTFLAQGFIKKHNCKYFCGPALFQIGLNSLSSEKLRTIAAPILHRLAMESGETAHLAIPSNFKSLIIEVSDSPNPIRVASRSGTLADLYCSSTGKLFLAYLYKENFQEAIKHLELKKRAKNTITSTEKLYKELEKVLQQKFAVDNQEYFDGVRCLAVPVYDTHNTIIAAVGITATIGRFPKNKEIEIAKLANAAAERINKNLKY